MKQLTRFQGWSLGFVISLILWCMIIGGTCALVGCSDPMTQGVLIGLGTSTATEEASKLAQDSKTQLVAKILQLQQELEQAATPEQQAALQAELDAANKKQEYVDLTSTIADTVKAGLERDWGDKPTQGEEGKNNLAYILATVAGLATTYAGKKTLDDRKKAVAINNVKVASKQGETMTSGEVYKAINGA